MNNFFFEVLGTIIVNLKDKKKTLPKVIKICSWIKIKFTLPVG